MEKSKQKKKNKSQKKWNKKPKSLKKDSINGEVVSFVKNFGDFIREQGVVGLAVGFVLGGSVKEVVSALVEDIINPLLGIFLGASDGLASATVQVGTATLSHGHFLSVVLDFVVIAFVVYYFVKGLGLDKLDKKKK